MISSKPIKKAIKKFLGLFPGKLPVGMTAFDHFATDLFETYDLPNLPSYKHAVATAMLHLGPLGHRKSKYYFFKIIKASMTKQIAYEVVNELKKEQQKKIEEEKKLKEDLAVAAVNA